MSLRRFEFDDGSGVRRFCELTLGRGPRGSLRMGQTRGRDLVSDRHTYYPTVEECGLLIDRLSRRHQASLAPRVPAAAPLAGEPTLEAAIAAAPDDEGAYLVYADWLSERDDPRGELIQRHARRRHARAAEWIDGHVSAFLGELRAGSEWPVQLDWQLGFVRAARVRVGRLDQISALQALEQLLPLASARFLRELHLGEIGEPHTYADLVAALVRHPPVHLTRLTLADAPEVWHTPGFPYALGDLTALLRALPALSDLTLGGVSVELSALELPRLRRLALEVSHATRQNFAALADAEWPELEELELWIGNTHPDVDARVHTSHIEAVLAAPRLPRLRRLAIRGCPFADTLVKHLVELPIFAQLSHLDLTYGGLHDYGVRVLAGAIDRFRQLQGLDVRENLIDTTGRSLLLDSDLPGLAVEPQRLRAHDTYSPGVLRGRRAERARAAAEQAFVDAPDDAGVRDAYVAALRADHDPRAEALELEARGDHDEAERWRRRHAFAFYGGLADELGASLHVEWRHGGMRRVRIERASVAPNEAPTLVDRLDGLLALPGARRLEELVIGARDPGSMAALVATLERRAPSYLRELHLGDGCAFAPPYLDECHLSELWPALPALERLTVRAQRVICGQAMTTTLRSLTIACPELRPGDLRVVLEAAQLGLLRHLALTHTQGTDALVRELADASLLPRLATLDLSHGALDLEGARALAANAARFAHLERLDLTGQSLDAETRAVLAGAGLRGLQVDPLDGGAHARASSAPIARVVLLADPHAPRLAAFQAARAAAGLPPAAVVDWRQVHARPDALFEGTESDAPHLLRIDAPPRARQVTPAGVRVPGRAALLPLTTTLAALADALAARPGWRVLTPPATLMVLLDPGFVAAELGRAGVPVPAPLGPALDHATLRARMDETGVTSARLRLADPDGARGVAVLARTPAGPILSTPLGVLPDGELVDTGHVLRLSDPDAIERLVTSCLLAGAHAEATLRPAKLLGRRVELRVRLVAGEPVFAEAVKDVGAFDHAVARGTHHRFDLDWFRAQLPAGVYDDAMATCRRVHAALPSLQLGVTLAFDGDFDRHLVTDVTGFDDHLPAPVRSPVWVYDHEVAPMLATPPPPSTPPAA